MKSFIVNALFDFKLNTHILQYRLYVQVRSPARTMERSVPSPISRPNQSSDISPPPPFLLGWVIHKTFRTFSTQISTIILLLFIVTNSPMPIQTFVIVEVTRDEKIRQRFAFGSACFHFLFILPGVPIQYGLFTSPAARAVLHVKRSPKNTK